MRRAWWIYLFLGTALGCAYWSLTPFQAALVAWPIFGGGCVVAMLVGVRRHAPAAKAAWLLLAAGTAALSVGDDIFNYLDWYRGFDTFPSFVDVIYLAMYPLMIAGMVQLVRRRSTGRDTASLIDTTILTGAMGLLSWVFLMAPYTRDDMTLLARLTSLAYPLGDVAVLAVLLRLAVGSGRRPFAFWLLVIGVIPMIGADSVYGYLSMIGAWQGQHPAEAGWIIFFVTWGAAALHPSMRELSEPATELPVARPARLVAVGSAALIPPAVLVVESVGQVRDALAIGAFTIGMYSLVIVRIVGLARQVAAARSEVRFRALVQNASDAILVVDPANTVTYETPSTHNLFGRSLVGLDALALRELLATEDRAALADVVESAAGAGAFQWRVRHVSGAWRNVEVNVVDLRHEPNVGGLVFTLRDTTERTEVEHLREEALRAAEEASHQKSVFLANMSHEIRTPLNGVIGMIGLLSETELDAVQREYAETVTASAESLAAIVNDVLDFSRIEAGKLAAETRPFALRAALEAAMALSVVPAHEKGLTLVCVVDPHVPDVVMGDRVRFRQVVGNLVTNATKFTQAGEVVIHATSEDGWLRVAVSDTGIGIAPEQADRLFEQYVQADASTTRKFGGTGLGLAISKQLVELMGGTIAVTSKPGEGSTFSFVLPLIAGPRGTTLDAALPPALTECRTLVLSAHPSVRRSVVTMFERWALVCEAAADPVDAQARLLAAAGDGHPFDFLVFDERNAGTTEATVAALRREPALAGLRVVGLVERPHADRKHTRFDACLGKPVRGSVMFDCLANLMTNRGNELTERCDAAPATPPVTSAGHLLLVEDNLINQRVAFALLRQLGFTVDVAANGEEGVAMARVGTYDAVLMDCQMPVMDGYTATREIRRSQNRRLPIIAITASAVSSDRATCLAAGMDDYLSKPIDRTALARVLQRCLGAQTALTGP